MKFLSIFALILPVIHARSITNDVNSNDLGDEPFSIVPRSEWHARPPTEIEDMPNPVPYVVIHHTYQPAACYTFKDCISAMEWIQDLHQLNNSWADIGYSFTVGGDDRVYMGRGWSRVGAHAPGYNNRSIGISIIGDWTVELPPAYQLDKVKELIQYGIDTGKIVEDYKLVGHRQVRVGTECPGDRLFAEIKNWPHWDPTAKPPEENSF